MILQKKILLYAPDLEQFEEGRGFYMRIDQMPARIVEEGSELASALRDTDENYDSQAQRAFYETCLFACDGGATERIARLME